MGLLGTNFGTAGKNIYPNDINGAIADGLKKDLPDWDVVVANLSDPDQGISDELLNRCDVMIWWGHKKHGEVKDALVEKIFKRVTEQGMGFISLHSAHFAKINIKLMSVMPTKKEILDKVQPKGRVAAWGAYIGALHAAGVAVNGHGLQSRSTATTLRLKDGKRQVQDGPYAEAKEQLGGFYIIDAPDLDTALEWASRCPAAASAAVEVRPNLST